jgi:hypothetical protein
MQAKQYMNGVKVPMPTDQLYNFTFHFTEVYGKIQVNVRMIWVAGLPFSVPGSNTYRAGLTAPPYRRVDFGISYCLLNEEEQTYRSNSIWRNVRNVWIGADVFNLFDIKNVSSYSWFSDVMGTKYAVPDRLTGRQFNIKLIAEF